jgi:aspartokinase/homoserine dehydrogenase 1
VKVLKFGGTSVQSASTMKLVLECIKLSCTNSCVVVLSAVSGTTDLLIRAAKNSICDFELSIKIIEQIKNLHLQILNDLFSDNNYEAGIINKIIEELYQKINAFRNLGEVTTQNIDSVQSYGEILSTTIFAGYCKSIKLNVELLNSGNYIFTDSNFTNAKVDFNKSLNGIIQNYDTFNQQKIFITQGFIAADSKNRTTTLGRGGSDYSAAVYGKLLKQAGFEIDEIQIWTDVNGVFSADPRQINNAQTITVMSPDEIRELSYLGAKVLHSDTIKPAIDLDIPVKVLNTFQNDNSGTLIVSNSDTSAPRMNSMIVLENVYELIVKASFENSAFELMLKALNITSSGNCHTIYSSIKDNVATLLFKYNPELFSESRLAEHLILNKINLIAITGHKLFRISSKIMKLMNFQEFTISGITDSSIFLTTVNTIEKEVINKIHDIIIEN